LGFALPSAALSRVTVHWVRIAFPQKMNVGGLEKMMDDASVERPRSANTPSLRVRLTGWHTPLPLAHSSRRFPQTDPRAGAEDSRRPSSFHVPRDEERTSSQRASLHSSGPNNPMQRIDSTQGNFVALLCLSLHKDVSHNSQDSKCFLRRSFSFCGPCSVCARLRVLQNGVSRCGCLSARVRCAQYQAKGIRAPRAPINGTGDVVSRRARVA